MNYEDRVTKAAVEAAIAGAGSGAQLVVGTYVGNGKNRQDIQLGFLPLAVLVIAPCLEAVSMAMPGYPGYTSTGLAALLYANNGSFTVLGDLNLTHADESYSYRYIAIKSAGTT